MNQNYQLIRIPELIIHMAVVPPISLLLWSAIFSLALYHAWAQDPCSAHNVLNDESRSILEYSSLHSSDSARSGWYRFMGKAGDKMLDYAPTGITGLNGKYRCGATMTGYLVGQHPKGSEGTVDRTVCFAYSGSNCLRSGTIQVKNCGNYFVYKLSGTPSAYNSRYCGSGEMSK